MHGEDAMYTYHIGLMVLLTAATTLQNIGYVLGTYSSIGDLGVKGSSLFLNTEEYDIINHSAIILSNEKTIISIGPSKSWF